MRTLILYYSFTGNTRKVAELLAKQLGADIGEFTCKAYTYGFWGGMRQVLNTFTGGTPPIEVPPEASGNYDLVVIGGPVWAARPAPPLRSFLKNHTAAFRNIALFVSCNGTSEQFPPGKAMAEMVGLIKGTPKATRIFTEADIQGDDLPAAIESFAEALGAEKTKPTRPSKTKVAKTEKKSPDEAQNS